MERNWFLQKHYEMLWITSINLKYENIGGQQH